MVSGQEQVPEAEVLGSLLELLDYGGVGGEALFAGSAELFSEDGVGGDTFFIDELLDL